MGRRPVIIIGTRLQDPVEGAEMRKRPQKLSTMTNREEEAQKNYTIQDDVEYAEGTQLFMEQDDHGGNV